MPTSPDIDPYQPEYEALHPVPLAELEVAEIAKRTGGVIRRTLVGGTAVIFENSSTQLLFEAHTDPKVIQFDGPTHRLGEINIITLYSPSALLSENSLTIVGPVTESHFGDSRVVSWMIFDKEEGFQQRVQSIDRAPKAVQNAAQQARDAYDRSLRGE